MKKLLFALVLLFVPHIAHAQKSTVCPALNEPKPQTGFFEARKAAKDKAQRKAAKDFRDLTRSHCWGTYIKPQKLKFRKP